LLAGLEALDLRKGRFRLVSNKDLSSLNTNGAKVLDLPFMIALVGVKMYFPEGFKLAVGERCATPTEA
jgi:hypothetical protein